MIVAIDGPTASGKSTIACMLAEKLGYYYIATGLLYRALAYILMHNVHIEQDALVGVGLEDIKKCLDDQLFVYDYKGFTGAAIYFKGENITPFLKTKEIDKAASLIATNQHARAELLKFQHRFSERNHIVMEGRDIGSVVFPNADYKFFITAEPAVRADRWRIDQSHKGFQISAYDSLNMITERDTRDKERSISPLKIAPGAVVIDTTLLNKEQALQKILSHMA